MKWKSLISTKNLKLAWRRINTGKNLQYKRFFREAYLVYESSIDENIRELHKELSAKAWKPSHATRIYIPKPSGLQRPLSLLKIEDQIVLQAVANQFANRISRTREQVELKSVFSNKLIRPAGSIFFMDRWQTTYCEFQKKCVDAFTAGLRWSAEFDLSAYYDTISHELLLKLLESPSSETETINSIKDWLLVWSANDSSAMTSHGIPQGPIASNLLAEAFFLPVDKKLQKEKYTYLRYVDDIRLFARTENEVRDATISLEQECRHRGLIPQSSKFDIRKVVTKQEAMGSLPSINPTSGPDSTPKDMTTHEARRILKSAISGRPRKVTDKSRFRYVMYRAPADNEILNTALSMLSRHPEHIDAICAYFDNYDKRSRIANVALSYLETGVPYSYVRGELWHIVAKFAENADLIRGLKAAKKDAKIRSKCTVLSWGVMHFMIKCEESGLIKNKRRLKTEKHISNSLLAPIFPNSEFSKSTGHGSLLLKGSLMEQLAGARELQKRKITLNSIGYRQRDLKPTCRRALKSLGVIKRRINQPKRDWVGELLSEFFKIKKSNIWKPLLGTEYEHAYQLLIESKARFSGAYSEWLSLHDSFSDLLTRNLIQFLKTKKLVGKIDLTTTKGHLQNYGFLIVRNGIFDKQYPNISKPLRDIHDRRNKLPGSHPYDKKGGTKNVWLKKNERDRFYSAAKISLQNIINLVEPII